MVFWSASCGLVSFLVVLCSFSFFAKQDQNRTLQKPKKTKMQKKKDPQKIQLAQLCSQIVFLIFGGWATKMLFLLKPNNNRGFSIFWEGKRAQNVKTIESNICPSMLRNIIGQIFDSKDGNVLFFFGFVFWISFSLQKEIFLKKTNEENKRKICTDVGLKKGNFWTDFWLYSIYIYI